jgi:hypothetical protein
MEYVARDEKLDERSLYKEYETHLSYNASDLSSESYDCYGWIFEKNSRSEVCCAMVRLSNSRAASPVSLLYKNRVWPEAVITA